MKSECKNTHTSAAVVVVVDAVVVLSVGVVVVTVDVVVGVGDVGLAVEESASGLVTTRLFPGTDLALQTVARTQMLGAGMRQTESPFMKRSSFTVPDKHFPRC